MAKLIILLLLSLASCAMAASYFDVVNGVPDRLASRFSLREATLPTCLDKYKTICANCTHYMQCLGTATTEHIAPCTSLDPANIFCDGDKLCQPATTDIECKADAGKSDFTCTAEGYMPDAGDCTKYHYCDAPGPNAVSYTCPTGFVYDVNLEQCKRRVNTADCVTMTCAKDKVIFVAHAANKAYYSFCNGPKNSSVVMKCDDLEHEQIDVKTGLCKVTCSKEGYIPSTKDCKTYYQCILLSGKLQMEEKSCPGTTEFNPGTSKCEKGYICKATTTASPNGSQTTSA